MKISFKSAPMFLGHIYTPMSRYSCIHTKAPSIGIPCRGLLLKKLLTIMGLAVSARNAFWFAKATASSNDGWDVLVKSMSAILKNYGGSTFK